MRNVRTVLPLDPLLAEFQRQPHVVSESPIRAAVNLAELDSLPSLELAEQLRRFYLDAVPLPWHANTITRNVALIRHGINHLLRGTEPLPVKFARCVQPRGVYFVVGRGPALWSAIVKAMNPECFPAWSPGVAWGLIRVGQITESEPYPIAGFATACAAYSAILVANPTLTANDLDQFFHRVAQMRGRELPPSLADDRLTIRIPELVRRVRTALPLRRRLTAHRELLPTNEPAPVVFAGLPVFDDADHPSLSPQERTALLADVTEVLRDRFRVHPLEVPDLLKLASGNESDRETDDRGGPRFVGFCTDTFRFLDELRANNSANWMATQRDRYRFAVREPLVELCDALTKRYVEPVLCGEYGWELETNPRPGRAITSICKNDFGRSSAYQHVLGIAFYRRSIGTRRADVQLFVRVDDNGVSFGFHLSRHARDAGRRFRLNVQEHAELLFRALRATGAADECRFAVGEASDKPVSLQSATDLRAWATERDLFAERRLSPVDPVLRSDDLVNEVLLTFDRLVPLFAACVQDDPRPILARRAGDPTSAAPFDRTAFRSETGLSDIWLARTLDLLRLKKQLILQGVPGTGKTHVARTLAKLLTNGRADAVRLVQFHPGYSYEEFVEGIRPRSVEIHGRSEVTYPVAEGVLVAFATQAAARPTDPHVLLIDEVNRGNLPRVFGELLFLLEYRDQAVTLPYSKREFRLPPNLILIGTMNPTDRSTAALDQALRRRFSFVDMPPDSRVLASWLESHPPEPDDGFGVQVVRLFEQLNRRLVHDLGPDKQIGHSYFMLPGLDEAKLRTVWDHHVLPVLTEYFAGHTAKLSTYRLDRLLGERERV